MLEIRDSERLRRRYTRISRRAPGLSAKQVITGGPAGSHRVSAPSSGRMHLRCTAYSIPIGLQFIEARDMKYLFRE
ncbi:hypothetical protein EVAR_70744_1 [Eumeta japonica]|uniref:Uncharacterized protein n=1 Tax=Eumeta variegata TaxID=151549 RepID=A0A4C2AH62_EUMVA|nr:hypothetical protein EVAR_70744_1 [Eumeta japonica]